MKTKDELRKRAASTFSILGGFGGFAIGASLWLLPYSGFLTKGYDSLLIILLMSIIGIFAVLGSFALATPYRPKSFHKGLFLGNFVSIAMWFGLLFTNNLVGPNTTIIWQDTGVAEYTGSEYVYPFWNNDFVEVYNTTDKISYSMDERCGDDICTVRTSVHYTVDATFVLHNAGRINNYAPWVEDALVEAVVRDEAYSNLEDLQTAVCSNFKANVGLADDAACPLNLRVSLNVTQN